MVMEAEVYRRREKRGDCVVPENIHTHPKEGHSEGEGGSQKPNFLKESMKLNWKFQGGGGFQPKKPSVGEVWIFSGTAHSQLEPGEIHNL